MADVEQSIHIEAPPEEVFDLFRDPNTFVELITGLQDAYREGDSVEWVAEGPLGIKLSGEAAIVEEERPTRVRWKSTSGALEVDGTARFAPEQDGTKLTYTLSYEVPGGMAGKAVAGALTDMDGQIRHTLAQLKHLAEN